MSSFRTSSLFRFCNEFEMLKKVLRNGIYPNYCEEDLSFSSTDFRIGIPMVSFCDIPITLLEEHHNRYGVYGIGLKKEWGFANGITPIMYVANDNVLSSVYYYVNAGRQLLEKVNSEDYKNEAIMQTIFSGFPLDKYIEAIEADHKHEINTHIVGYLKKYSGEYKNNKIINYSENEWRYIIPDTAETPWMWSHDEYVKWRSPEGKKDCPKPAPTEALKSNGLTFTVNDINYIIVKDEFKDRLIKFLRETKNFGGGMHPLTEEELLSIVSRIITVEQVKNDF